MKGEKTLMATRPQTIAPMSQQQPRTDARFQDRALVSARVVWITVALLELVLILFNVFAPAFGNQTTICPISSTCGYAPTTLQALQHAQIPVAAFADYLLVLGLIDALITIGVGVLLFWRKSDQPSGWLASVMLLLWGAGLLHGDDSVPAPLVLDLISYLLTFGLPVAIGFFIVTFPDGRLVPHWSWLAGSTLFLQALLYQLPGAWNVGNWPAPLLLVETILAFGSPVAVQIYRYVRISHRAQRQQTKWAIFSLICCVLLVVLQTLAEALVPSLKAPDSLYPLVSASLIPSLTFLLIPIGISIAILRSRLWDIDRIINRTLVYGTLSAILALVYVGSIVLFQTLFRGIIHQDNAGAIVVSTLVSAALVHPLRRRLQALIDRRFYRRKYDAAKTVAAFTATLRNEVDLSQLSETLTMIVQETMQPSHVSRWLRQREQHISSWEQISLE